MPTTTESKTTTPGVSHLEIIHDALDSDELARTVQTSVRDELTRRDLTVLGVSATYTQSAPATEEMLESGWLDVTAELATAEDGALNYFVTGAAVLALHRLGVEQA